MFLYHYGAAGYKALKTLEAQRPVTQAERKEALQKLEEIWYNVPPGPYYQHISFLFDPISTDHWKYFNRSHPVWNKGTILTEYVVDTSQIGEFKWMIVETPEITEPRRDETVSDEDFRKLYIRVNQAKYVGSGSGALEKASREFVGHQKEYLKIASKLNPDSMRYAADVPHVMLYPKEGMVLFESQRRIELL